MQESMDLSEFQSEDDLSGYDYPSEGQYHLVCSDVDATREKSQAVYLTFTILEGTTPGQVNKTFIERLADPDFGQKDGGKFCRKRQTKVLLALGVLTPEMLGQPNVTYDWSDCLWRQCKAAVVNYDRESQDGKRYRGAQIDGMEIYGPLDPAAQHIPHDNEGIAMAKDGGQPNVVKFFQQGGGGQSGTGQQATGQGKPDVKAQMAARQQAGQQGGQTSAPQQGQPQQANDPYAGL